MTNVERVERDIAREKMFREAFMNGKEPTDEDNSKEFKKVYENLYTAFLRQTRSRRFSISA